MNILMVAGPFVSLREPYDGGTESFIVELANELVRQGHHVDVIAKDTDERNLFRVVEFHESPFSMKDDSFRPCPEWLGQRHYQALQYGLFDIGPYDIIHYNSYVPEMYEVGSLFQAPSVVTLHVPPLPKFQLLYELFVKNTGAVPVAISERMRQQWQPSINTKIPVILNGILMDAWTVHDHDVDGYLLWCGRITAEKNIEAAIHLAKHTKRSLKVIGPVFDREYFTKKVKAHIGGLIEYIPHGSRSDLNQLAAGASLLLATATWDEPFGLSTVEMLASGVPVLGFESAIPPELRCTGVSTAVHSCDWQDLVEPIETTRMAKASDCRKFALTFDIARTAANYVKLYEETIKVKSK